MKNTFDLTKLAFLATIAGIFAAASAHADDKTNYITVKEITAMPPCTVTFAKRLSEFSGFFTNANGKAIVLGDIRGEQWVWHFVVALKEGQAYKLPDAFLNYQAAPHYVTAREITAMVPRTATLIHGWHGSGYFKTADGKGFFIGGGRSGEEVDRFLRTLEEEKTYEFPDAFLKYQKPQPTTKP